MLLSLQKWLFERETVLEIIGLKLTAEIKREKNVPTKVMCVCALFGAVYIFNEGLGGYYSVVKPKTEMEYGKNQVSEKKGHHHEVCACII